MRDVSQVRLVVATQFKRDVEQTVSRRKDWFGRPAANRYLSHINSALHQIATNPRHPIIHGQFPQWPIVRTLHLRDVVGEVKQPRHLICFVVDETERRINVIRLLHEAMDVEWLLTTDLVADSV